MTNMVEVINKCFGNMRGEKKLVEGLSGDHQGGRGRTRRFISRTQAKVVHKGMDAKSHRSVKKSQDNVSTEADGRSFVKSAARI